MARIPESYLGCVAYIYPNRQAAEDGERAGGSGFIVARRVEGADTTFFVTNRHVIDKAANPFIRINKVGGGVEPFETNRLRWKDHPDGDDVSAIQIDVSAAEHDIAWVFECGFVTPDIIAQYNIGIGDHVAMLGRFVGHDGKFRNTPTARFGNISMMTAETLRNRFGHDQETFLVECHSIPGFSGSPVLIYFPTSARSEAALLNPGLGPWLLGIDWLHLHDNEPVRDAEDKEILAVKNAYGKEIFPKSHVHSNTGMAGVIPAWRIPGLLDEFFPRQ